MAKDSKGHGSNGKGYGGKPPAVIEASGKTRKPLRMEVATKKRPLVIPSSPTRKPYVIKGTADKRPRVIPGSLSRAQRRK